MEIKISKEDKSYRHAAYLDDISSFDNELFQLSDAESRLIDPKQRLLLMTAYRAFEDAGVFWKNFQIPIQAFFYWE